MTSEELVEALRWAQGRDTDEPPERWGEKRALLDAVRWFVAHEFGTKSGQQWAATNYCIQCGTVTPTHEPTCPVGQWVRAAREAGLG